jgi:acetyl-CoA carboxylase biotin carboxyl carrier protein
MDLDYLKKLAALMKETELYELAIEEEGISIRLRRGPKGVSQMMSAFGGVAPMSSAPAGAAADGIGEEELGIVLIKSPIVGTFYRSPSPDAGPFVNVGSSVEDETTVCIVEAMKVMNEIKAEVSGEIVAVLVEDAAPVQYGTPLFKVRPN